MFGNLLDDSAINKGVKPQSERLINIADNFTKHQDANIPNIAAWCEGADKDCLFALAKLTGMTLISTPEQYSPNEWMGIAISPGLNVDRAPKFIHYGKERDGFRHCIMEVKIAGIEIRIIHNPHHVIGAIKDRNNATDLLLRDPRLKGPTIIVGDFNALAFQYARTSLTDNGFHEVYADERPPYPTREFKGKTFPRFIKLSLDAMLITDHFTVINRKIISTKSSDHPFLSVGLRRETPSNRKDYPRLVTSTN